MIYDLVIVGGGAGGLFAGVMAGKKGLKTLIIERENKLGKKLSATGNGRCNIANTNFCFNCDLPYYNNNKFVESMFKSLGLNNVEDFLQLLKSEFGILTYADSEGRVYPICNYAPNIVSILSNLLNEYGVEVKLNTVVGDIDKDGDEFAIFADNMVRAKNVLLCCGGSATILAENLGHNRTNLKKGLVGIKTKQNFKWISGVRVDNAKISVALNNIKEAKDKNIEISNNVYSEIGEIIFKDDGISGICVMNISSILNRYNTFENLSLDLISNKSKQELKLEMLEFAKKFKNGIVNYLYSLFPYKLANYLFETYKTPDEIAKNIKRFKLDFIDFYSNNQVTIGGIETDELDITKSKNCENLYISGEMLNIDGLCGGYNLMFAILSALSSVKTILK